VGTDADQLSRPLGARVHGTALVLYFALLPYVVLSKWQHTSRESSGSLIRALLVVLGLFWLGFLVQVIRNVWRLRRGRRVSSGGSAWLAGLVVAMMALAVPNHVPAHTPTAISITHQSTSRGAHHHLPPPLISLSPLTLALMAKRRHDLLRQPDGERLFDVDESIDVLRSLDPELIGHLVALIGDACDGVLDIGDPPSSSAGLVPRSAMVACSLGPSATGSLIGFAREGGRLPIRASWSTDDIQRQVVALHEGAVSFARNEPELLRALATRALRHSVVLYLGPAGELDDELSACAITLTPYLTHETRVPTRTVAEPPRGTDLRVELLRADPRVVGMTEPFAPTLRRRCVEMVAYLALHRHEPVTGERLRTRVLVHADVEASTRTLANTASAVRRSLGIDAHGPRLHPVTSSGLYATHGISSDVEVFSTLVARARQLPVADAASLAREALLLIQGEPLASTLRGFEWFLAEGHAARLARDGEWAALALHHDSLQRGNYELAFWSLQQGLLIDPYSDALAEALSRVPRLREFGGNGTRLAQHQPVGTGGTVAMSWSLSGLSQQVFQ
jgi:DNA-binding SARP family transcriptional activator